MPTRVDSILESICDFGRYQKLVVLLLTIPACFQNAFNLFGPVFLFFTPDHVCRLPSNQTTLANYLKDDELFSNGSQHSPHWNAGACRIETTLFENDAVAPDHILKIPTLDTDCPYGWEYDATYFQSTLVTEWDLVCERSLHARNMLFALSLSAAIGCFFIACIQDKYGRRPAFLISLALYVVPSLGSIFARNPLEFTIIRSIAALPTISSWNVGYCWAIEFVGLRRRTLVTTLLCIFYAVSVMTLGVIAHFCTTWTQLVLATTLPFLPAFGLAWVIDESPQWLFAEGRKVEAVAVFQRIAKWEGLEMSASKLDLLLTSSGNDEERDSNSDNIASPNNQCNSNAVANASLPSPPSRESGLYLLFNNANLRAKLLLVTVCMTACNIVYNTIGYNVENLGGHFTIVFILQASMEAPATMLNLLVLDRYGRVWPLTTGTLLSALFILLTVPGDLVSPWLTAGFAIAGKFFICCSYANIFQLSGELFPTILRGEGVGFSCIVAEVVNTVMPYILHSSELYKMLPMVILGVLCSIGGLTAMVLPETLNKPMPQTIAEAERAVSGAGTVAFKENIRRICGSGGKSRRKRPETPKRHPLLLIA